MRIRNVSPIECSYLAMDSAKCSPMVNQYIVEGVGELQIDHWERAVKQACQSNPSIRAKLKGYLAWRYWDDSGELPRVIFYCSNWLGESSEGASFDNTKMDCRKGLCAEVHLIDGMFPKVVFRVHHALMDGNATLFWIHEVFRALRNEPLLGSQATLNEWDLVKTLNLPTSKVFNGPCKSIFKYENNTFESDCIWQNVQLHGKAEKVLPKVIQFLAKKARENKANAGGKIMFRVPSNLRRFLEEDSYQLSNLMASLDVDIEEIDTDKSIYKRILKGLYKKLDASAFSKNLWLMKYLPKKLFIRNMKMIGQQYDKGLCDITGIIAHVGAVSLENISYKNFSAKNIYATPLPIEGVSLSCVIVENNWGISICFSASKHLTNYKDMINMGKQLDDVL